MKWIVLLIFLSGCVQIKNKKDLSHKEEQEYTSPRSTSDSKDSPPMDIAAAHPQSEIEIDQDTVVTAQGFVSLQDWNNLTFLQKQNSLSAKKITLYLTQLYLKNKSVLFTLDQNIDIFVDEIVSEDGWIANFPLNAQAQVGQKGRSGGRIFLKAKKGAGYISFLFNGEKGGAGFNGESPDLSFKGAKGNDGFSGTFEVSSCTPRQMFCPARCLEIPKYEGDGQVGQKGAPGSSGFKGGDSGSAKIIILDVSQITADFKIEPGQGGPGGQGGAGGEGGDPGRHFPPGHLSCPFANEDRPGQKGPTGPQGDNGSEGPPGQQQKICIQLGAEEQCF